MGFGNGYSSRTDRGSKRYANDMVAHVWNAQEESSGQSGNGNFYFIGRTLYSYGSHFVVGYIMPDGVAFLNADRCSVSTSGHQSAARGATRNRRTVSVAGLTDLAGEWKLLPRLARWISDGKPAADKAEMQKLARHALLVYAEALSANIYAAGGSRYRYVLTPDSAVSVGYTEEIAGEMEAGAYLARLAGLPAATWPKLKREAATLAKRAADDKAKADRAAAEGRALRLADMPGRQWREQFAQLGTEYSAAGFDSLATELRRARKLALATKSGKLASKTRLATIRARLKQVTAERDLFAVKRQPRLDRQALAIHLATVRNWRDATPAAKLAAGYYDLKNLERAADYIAERGRSASLRAAAARLAEVTSTRAAVVATEAERLRELERVNRAAAQAERKAAWLRGEPVGSVRFDAETGGAALRIVGDVLETSHGASVPLEHAIKAFRFIKLCRERGESFHRNGRTIRVGHFQVDSISTSGDFVAGCHNFTWPEVERVARLAGVFDAPADDSAVIPSNLAA